MSRFAVCIFFPITIVAASVWILCAQSTPEKGIAKENTSLHAEKPTGTNKDKDHTNNVASALNPENHPPSCASNAKQSEENIDIQRNLAHFTKRLVIVGFLQFVVLAATVFVIWRQANFLKNSERAWVHVEAVRASLGPDPPYILRVSNYGKTPADIISYRIGCFSIEGAEKTLESGKSQDNIHILLAQNSSKDFESFSITEAFSLSWNEVRVGRKDNTIDIAVFYLDIFSRNKAHFTTMAYAYNPAGRNIINLPTLTRYT